MLQYHLNSKFCSGRGVRIRMLPAHEFDKIMATAAKELGPDATMFELRRKTLSEGVKRMVVAVTNEEKLDDLGKATWKEVNAEVLEDNYAKYFNSKDSRVLEEIYRMLHEADQKEIDDIMGKALTVSEV